MEKHSTTSEEKCPKPSPEDIAAYLPWACGQLQLDYAVEVTRVQQADYMGSTISGNKSKTAIKNKLKQGQSRIEMDSTQEKEEKSIKYLPTMMHTKRVIKISVVCDNSDNVTQINFDRNREIPRTLLKLLGLIIQFQRYLSGITIKRGIDKYTLHEISYLLQLANITDICLDDSLLNEANYYILLENPSQLRQLSLARCRIDDTVLKSIVSRLIYPFPASKTLSVLNLTSNKITDLGAQYVADTLRTNRQLFYLNLSDNRLTDEGASQILGVLKKFPLATEEMLQSRMRYVHYLIQKNEMITQMVNELKSSEFEKKASRRKSTKTPQAMAKKGKGLEKETSKTFGDSNRSIADMEALFYERALLMAVNALGEFDDPFNVTNIELEYDTVYCYGNNYLCYLNLSHNNLSYLTVKKLLEVLIYQRSMNRKPRGLLNIYIEGNEMPIMCKELDKIDEILENGVMVMNRKMSVVKKKPLARSVR